MSIIVKFDFHKHGCLKVVLVDEEVEVRDRLTAFTLKIVWNLQAHGALELKRHFQRNICRQLRQNSYIRKELWFRGDIAFLILVAG